MDDTITPPNKYINNPPSNSELIDRSSKTINITSAATFAAADEISEVEGFNGMTSQIVQKFSEWFHTYPDGARSMLEYQGKNYGKRNVMDAYQKNLGGATMRTWEKYYNKVLGALHRDGERRPKKTKHPYGWDGVKRA